VRFLVLLTLPTLTACERPAPPVATATPAATGSAPSAARSELPDEAVFLAQVDRTRGTKDCFLPLRDPPFVPAAAATGMRDDELVLALDVGTDAVCYPTDYLNFHEIVEHRMAGLELLACW
jgi:hypothetical protein